MSQKSIEFFTTVNVVPGQTFVTRLPSRNFWNTSEYYDDEKDPPLIVNSVETHGVSFSNFRNFKKLFSWLAFNTYFKREIEPTKEELILFRIKQTYAKCKTTKHWVTQHTPGISDYL